MKKIIKNMAGCIALVFIIPFLVTLIMSGVGLEKDRIGLALLKELVSGSAGSAVVTVGYDIGREKMPLDEFIAGVIAPAYEYCDSEEFLKAMAVMCRTYIKYCNENNRECDLKYYSENDLEKIWGTNYAAVRDRIYGAVKATDSQYIVCGEKAIYPYWHYVTSGYTRNFREEKDYLCEAECTEDSLEEDYVTVMEFSNADFIKLIKKKYPKIFISEEKPAEQIQVIDKSTGGYVTTLFVGNIMIDGDSLVEILGLPSASFVISETEGGLRFTVKGQGGGYGVSLAFAAREAGRGKGYKEIINYFYRGVQFKKLA